jgi:hypothetical protein
LPWSVETGADGTFELERVPPRAMTATATRVAAGDWGSGRCEIAGLRPPVGDLELRLERWRLVTGRVLDAAGRPMAGANVTLRARRPDGTGGRVWTTKTDEDGSFSVEDVTSENTLWAWSDAHAELAMAVVTDVRPGGSALEIRLVPGGPLEARVVDERGEALTGGGTFYVLDDAGRLHNSANLQGGRLRTHALPFDRSFDLLVHVRGGRSGRLRDVRAGSRGLVVQLRKAAAIRGRVLGPGGGPAPAGTVVRAFAVRTSSRVRAGLAVEAKTREDGSFTLADISDLPFTVWAEPAPGDSETGASAAATGVLPGGEVTLRLVQGVAISGHYVSDDMAVGRSLWFVPDGDVPWHAEARTQAGGRFEVRGLASGGYTVWLLASDGGLRSLGRVRAPAAGVELQLPTR